MRHTPLALLLGLALVAPARAAVVVLDETTAGTVSDGIIEGFPGLAPKDGDPDFGGNPLSVAMRADVTELRSVMEVPLAPLAGFAPSSITRATLTANVDDVIATFGPNTNFNGMAADTEHHGAPRGGLACALLFYVFDLDDKSEEGRFRCIQVNCTAELHERGALYDNVWWHYALFHGKVDGHVVVQFLHQSTYDTGFGALEVVGR
jgi:hypothetical protein